MLKNQIVVEMLFGSHLYGLSNPNSDIDYVGVYMPTFYELVMGTAADTIDLSTNKSGTKNTKDDVDRVFYSLPYFIKQVEKGNTNALDMLHAPMSALLTTSEAWEDLHSMRKHAHTKTMASFVGYVRQQASKYGKKGVRLAAVMSALEATETFYERGGKPSALLGELFPFLPENEHAEFITLDVPNSGTQKFYELCNRKFQDSITVEYFYECVTKIEESYGHRAKASTGSGIDWKAVSHALRAGYQARAIFVHGDYTFPLAETQFLLDVKAGKIDFESVVAPELDRLVNEVEELTEKSDLPADARVKGEWPRLLSRIYSRTYGYVIDNPEGNVYNKTL